MRTDWPRHTVAELQAAGVLLVEDGNHGEYRPRHEEFVEHGEWAFIRAADMDDGRVLFDSAQKINDAAIARIRKGVGEGGDVLFSHKGTVGKLALAPLDAPPFVCSPQTTFWRTLDPNKLDRRFLYYFMQSDAFSSQWMSRKGETDMADYVSLTAQRQFEIAVPPFDEQQAIAAVLGALDDKIEQNRRTARALEELAQATFKAWFVDFEPVKAKAAGATGFPGMPAAAFAALPRRLTDSPLGPVPQGWRIVDVYELAKVVYGAPFASKLFNDTAIGRPLIRIRDLQTHSPSVFTTEQHAKGTLIQPGDVVVGMDGEFRLHYWTGPAAWLNQRLCSFQPLPSVPSMYLGEALRAPLHFVEQSEAATTVIHLGKYDIDRFELLRPDDDTLSAFGGLTSPMLKLIVHTASEASKLAAVREYLLPRLLSGQVRVRPPQVEGGV